MKKLQCVLCGMAMVLPGVMSADNVEMFSYSLPEGNSGLRIAWRADKDAQWQSIGNGYDFVRSDFGPWGSHKKMFAPELIYNVADSMWNCVWYADSKKQVTALAVSPDLIKWAPQRYFEKRVDLPRDMRPMYRVRPDSVSINGVEVGGYVQIVPEEVIASLDAYVKDRYDKNALFGQQASQDGERFAGLKGVKVDIVPRMAESKSISDKLVGIFFEDINYGADGGLYAELIQNRDFEYAPSDRGNDKNWNSTKAWSSSAGSIVIKNDNPVHENNPNYVALDAERNAVTLTNEGYDGISLKKGDRYRFSFMARSPKAVAVTVALVDKAGKVLSSAKVKVSSSEWTTYKAELKPSRTVSDASLAITVPAGSSLDADMISLFPTKTFKGRENGLRKDLAQTLADLKPRFVRFPGGCVAHGDGVDNIYDWKGSIGPLESRKPLRNLWGYHQTRGLGYHEYFLFCEDIDAEPLPVLAAGVPCQNSGTAAHHSHEAITTLGQQCGIPMEEMDAYVQDVLDLIEYANGDVTTEWGAKRAAAGHPEPFDLKYIGIGNEDMITEVFEPRFRMIYDAVTSRYPDVTVIGTVGPFYEGADYDRGWELARELDIPMVDEHYYVSPGWLIHNNNYYDDYPRGGTQVYLGEYASHLPGRPNNMETALSMALYLTGVERNGDVVAMTSYAPLLAKKDHTQWTPDLIYFDNDKVRLTTDYYVQHMYGNNAGTVFVPSEVKIDNVEADVVNRIGVSIVEDKEAGDYIVKLVNMLPVEADVNLDLTPLGLLSSRKVKGSMLTGDPKSDNVMPVDVSMTLPSVKLPAYSFTVLRVSK
ncbi:MAG TPA: alpha-L-arabinofuranosidase C-terminal domain-containing protein [Muribaculum sp.]|jgi:alpha-L-arabinofuranosidase|uniref:non-reducing end alpha-L-arabinofuranosidase n=1 Tax=Heminiphilus faecis TaxID=2601703 RepID=A0ABV4CWT5_9BACT|nr:alpha-L-arabinofuranosidase C-terminal domain-containing protein [Heminiphilus faecis]HRF69623.1 alpha-L-arabinofuranosidase C-terminal domain-containing protein [Muribaculum sp.]